LAVKVECRNRIFAVRALLNIERSGQRIRYTCRSQSIRECPTRSESRGWRGAGDCIGEFGGDIVGDIGNACVTERLVET
jgi:hypothetical protein